MSGDVKLSKAQQAYLALLATHPRTADASYKPSKRLVELGYAIRERRRIRMMVLYVFAITPAGLAALTKAQGLKSEEI